MSSSGKVKCTCGWSWNKSDSSKKDMYICHQCGRDNSNNMKNGGWLDSYEDGGTMQEHQENYNDNSVSLPEGYVGEGYDTTGRNYSPAWGGQFEEGGEIPKAQKGEKIIYVESKNDPRYKAYQDSLTVYKGGVEANKKMKPFIGMYKKPIIIDNNIQSKKLWMSSLGKKTGKTSHRLNDANITIEQPYKKGIAPINSNLYPLLKMCKIYRYKNVNNSPAIAISPVGNVITLPLICILPVSLVGPFTITLLNPDRVATKVVRPYKSLTLNVVSFPTAV
jgi:hypothetical protein